MEDSWQENNREVCSEPAASGDRPDWRRTCLFRDGSCMLFNFFAVDHMLSLIIFFGVRFSSLVILLSVYIILGIRNERVHKIVWPFFKDLLLCICNCARMSLCAPYT